MDRGLVERFINAKALEVSRDHWFTDQVALEALARFSDEELEHQELFRRVEALAAECMPAGYLVTADPNDVDAGRAFAEHEQRAVLDGVLKAYRWQYIVSGVQDGRFLGILTQLITPERTQRIAMALAPLM